VSYMVIFQSPDGNPGYNQFEALDAAIDFVELLRNAQGVENARMFELEEIKFELKPIYKVEMAALTTGAEAPVATESYEASVDEQYVPEVEAPAAPEPFVPEPAFQAPPAVDDTPVAAEYPAPPAAPDPLATYEPPAAVDLTAEAYPPPPVASAPDGGPSFAPPPPMPPNEQPAPPAPVAPVAEEAPARRGLFGR